MRELYLVCQQQAYRLDALLAPIHEVADQEELVDRRSAADHVQQSQKVVKLPVKISGDLDGRLDLHQRVFALEDFLRLFD